jgi:hypothetical protein
VRATTYDICGRARPCESVCAAISISSLMCVCVCVCACACIPQRCADRTMMFLFSRLGNNLVLSRGKRGRQRHRRLYKTPKRKERKKANRKGIPCSSCTRPSTTTYVHTMPSLPQETQPTAHDGPMCSSPTHSQSRRAGTARPSCVGHPPTQRGPRRRCSVAASLLCEKEWALRCSLGSSHGRG